VEARREAVRIEADRQTRQQRVSAHDRIDGIRTNVEDQVIRFQTGLYPTTGTVRRALPQLPRTLHYLAGGTGPTSVTA
jgi:hypothetical protein